MDFEVSYLQAIQEINGRTPAEKYREVNNIVRRLTDGVKESGDFASIGESPNIPKSLVPLIEIIVGKRLKKHDAVITALKSTDIRVVKQALRAKWFYSGKNKSIVNFKYFSKHLLPYISIKTRTKIISNLAVCLTGKEPELAEEFFNGFVDVIGIEYATPLLAACSEDFIYDAILKYKMILSNRLIRSLFRRYPNLVIRYLQLGNKNNENNKRDRELHSIQLHNYDSFLPRLIRGHANVFVELYELSPMMPLKLGTTRTSLFLNNVTDILINKPRIFLKIMPLERVCNGLTLAQFETMFANLFPEKLMDFCVNDMLSYLKYYPEDKKINLLQTTFEEKYKIKLFDDLKRVTRKVLLALPAEERTKHTRRILEVSPDWAFSYDTEWRCFLPVNEAIPIFKERISKSSNFDDRKRLLGCMLYCCKVNDNKEALLDVLRYYNERHRNEQGRTLGWLLGRLYNFSDLENSTETIWTILREIIQRAYIKNEIGTDSDGVQRALEKYIEFLFIQTEGKPIENNLMLKSYFDNAMKLILEIRVTRNCFLSWTIENARNGFDKYFLDQCLTLLPIQYPEDHTVWKDEPTLLTTIVQLVMSIHECNQQNVKKKSKRDASLLANESLRGGLSIKNYPWLVKRIIDISKAGSLTYPNKLNCIRDYVKKLDPDLYDSVKRNETEEIEIGEALRLLKRDYNNILNNWEKYLKLCRENYLVYRRSSTYTTDRRKLRAVNRFVRATIWYNDIPVKFTKKCLEEITIIGSIRVLASILDGDTFAQLIQPFTPTESAIDTNSESAKAQYTIMREITSVVSYVNPPVPLRILSTFCQSDFMQLALKSLENVARRTPVSEVITFAKELADKTISVKKQVIRLVCLVAPKNKLNEFLEDSWNREKHKSIREVLLKNIRDLYIERQNDEMHKLMIDCISSLTIDDESVFEDLLKLISVKSKYLGEIVETLLAKIDYLKKHGLTSERTNVITCFLLDSIGPQGAKTLSEQFLEETIRKYFLAELSNLCIFRSINKFMIEVYLLTAGDKLHARFDFVRKLLMKHCEKWNQADEKNIRFYPSNFVIHSFFSDVAKVSSMEDGRSFLTECALRIFSSILTPRKEPHAYILLIFCQELHDAISPKDFGFRIGRRLPGIVEEFCTDLILTQISDTLVDFLQPQLFTNIDMCELRIEFLEGLVSNVDIHSDIVVIRLLNLDIAKVYDARYDNIVRELRTRKNSTIEYLLQRHVNSYKNIDLYLE